MKSKRQITGNVLCGAFALFVAAGCKTATPIAAPSMEELAERSFEREQWELAASYYTRSISNTGERYSSFFNRGVCYKKLGRSDDALADFNNANEVMPKDSGKSELAMAALNLELGDFEKAIVYADEQEQEIGVNEAGSQIRTTALDKRSAALFEAGKFEQSLADLETLLDENADNTESQIRKAHCLFQINRSNTGREDTDKYLISLLKKSELNKEQRLDALKLQSVNRFFMRTPENAKAVFTQYVGLKGRGNLSVEDFFWAGLIEKVNLDEKGCLQYWSKISSKFVTQKLNSLKQYK